MRSPMSLQARNHLTAAARMHTVMLLISLVIVLCTKSEVCCNGTALIPAYVTHQQPAVTVWVRGESESCDPMKSYRQRLRLSGEC